MEEAGEGAYKLCHTLTYFHIFCSNILSENAGLESSWEYYTYFYTKDQFFPHYLG